MFFKHGVQSEIFTRNPFADVFPIQVVTSWLGNSPAIAQKHYLRVLPEHSERARSYRFNQAGCGGQVVGEVDKSADTAEGGQKIATESCQIAKRIATLEKRQVCSNTGQSETPQNTVYHASGNIGNTAKQPQIPPRGIEPSTKTPCFAVSGENEIAKRIAEFPQNLQTVIDGWPFLTQKEQQRITQFVNSRSLAPVE